MDASSTVERTYQRLQGEDSSSSLVQVKLLVLLELV